MLTIRQAQTGGDIDTGRGNNPLPQMRYVR